MQTARATKLVPESGAWDIELPLAVKVLPWDRRRADPAARIRLPAPEVAPEHVLVGEPVEPRARRVYIRRGSQVRSDDWVPGVHGHHSGNDRGPGSSRRCSKTPQEKERFVLKRPSGESEQGLMTRGQTWRWRGQQGLPFVPFNMGFQFVLGGGTRALAAQGR